jgi:hypothetical protein
MPINDFLNPKFYKSWEIDPSTRESLRLFTKAYPVDKTLATAGTAEDLITVDVGSKATVNIITNPSCETGATPTGYTAVRSGTLAKDGTYYKYGLYSLKITPPNAAAGEGAYWDLGKLPADTPIAVSAYMRRGAAGSPTARVELFAPSTPNALITNVRVAVGNTNTCDGNWQRSQLVSPVNRNITVLWISGVTGTFNEDELVTGGTSGATATVSTVASTYLIVRGGNGTQFSVDGGLPASETITGAGLATATVTKTEVIILDNTQFYLYFVTAAQTATAFYVDGVQAEFQESVTAYCDGSQGYLHWWDGSADASTSRRWRKLSSIRSYRLHCTRDIYMAYDIAANSSGTNAEDKGEYLPAGTDFGENHPIYLDKQMSFVNVVSGEQPRVYGLVWGC